MHGLCVAGNRWGNLTKKEYETKTLPILRIRAFDSRTPRRANGLLPGMPSLWRFWKFGVRNQNVESQAQAVTTQEESSQAQELVQHPHTILPTSAKISRLSATSGNQFMNKNTSGSLIASYEDMITALQEKLTRAEALNREILAEGSMLADCIRTDRAPHRIDLKIALDQWDFFYRSAKWNAAKEGAK